MPRRPAPGKLGFARAVLAGNPSADLASANRAWAEANGRGTIAPITWAKAVVLESRAESPAGPPHAQRRPAEPPMSARDPGRAEGLRAVEESIDRALFRATSIGTVPEVEEALRSVRRLVVLASLPCRPRVAVVGASTDRAKFGNKAVRAFLKAGFEVFPVHPKADFIEGLRAYPTLEHLPFDRLDRVSLYVPAAVGLEVLDQLARLRVGQLWLNPGADDPAVIARARELGLEVVQACSILAVGEHPDRL